MCILLKREEGISSLLIIIITRALSIKFLKGARAEFISKSGDEVGGEGMKGTPYIYSLGVD